MNSTKPDYVPPMGQLLAHQHPLITISLGLAAILLISKIFRPAKPTSARRTPPMLSETIPYITNTYQFITKMDKFMVRAAKALTHRTIIGFHLGPFGKRVYLVKSDANVTTLIKNSPSIGFEFLLLLGLENMMGFTPQDLAKFAGDKSGRLMSAPLPGTEHIPKEERYCAGLHEVMHKYLGNAYFANDLGVRYQGYLEEWLLSAYANQQQRGGQGQGQGGEGNDGWVEIPIGIVQFMKNHMARASTQSLMGTRLLQLVPDLLERFWAYDEIVGTLVLGPKPKWLFRDVYGKGDRFIEAMGKYFELADREFVWDDEEALRADWEEVFGSRFCRELVSFGKRSGLSLRSMGGMIGSVAMVALNANAIYVTIWGVMELAKDAELSRLIREEVEATFVIDQTTGMRRIDIQKLIALPRLQSLYLELMRTHVSMNVMREVMTPDFQLDGYHLPKGSLLAACTDIIHNDDRIWGAENHPATEFWAERHLRYVDADEIDVQTGRKKQVPRFQMARPTEFLSYGGGVSMCPGRHFVKQEIMLTLAYFASRFEIECVEWLNVDGTKSDREARNDPKYTGAAGVPPDRDMKVRWRRIW